jgi:chemotaxis methyl-accepting protein methylase
MFVRAHPLVVPFASHLHSLVRRFAERRQNHSTFFFRNRPELELMGRLAKRASHGSRMEIAIFACSKGAEVYSIVWTIRTARPDLKLTVHAIDISREILEFAKEGVYSLQNPDVSKAANRQGVIEAEKLTWNTHRDQPMASPFQRMSQPEMEAMFDHDGDQVRIKSWLKEGIHWHCGDAGDPALASLLGPQDLVVANRFLCHMDPATAERVLRNLDRFVKPCGYLFVSGVDLNIRKRVALEMKWKPVTELMEEIHEGDPSLRNGWPLEYWAKEPFQAKRNDAIFRFASAFQIDQEGSRRVA